MARFNWYILLACALVFAVGGTMFGLAAIVISGHTFVSLFSIALSAGLMLLSGLAIREMERF